MKKFELLKINEILMNSLYLKNHDFAYAVFKNKQLVENVLHEFDFFNDIDPEYAKYEELRIALCKRTCKKDDKGMDIVIDGRYEIEDKETFEKGMDLLQKDYKPFVDKRDEQIKKFNTIKQEDIDIPFEKVQKSDLPIEIDTAAEMFKYGFMIG